MIHVFVLYVFIITGENKQLVSNDMMFKSLADCVWYAQTLHRQGSNITAYCLPRGVKEDTKVY